MTKRKILVVSLMLVTVLAISFRLFFLPIITDSKGYTYTLQPGESIKTFARDLSSQAIFYHPLMLRILLRISGNSHALKAGQYHFESGTTLLAMIQQMTAGKGILYHSFMIIPGWNVQQVRKALHEDLHIHHLTETMNDNDLMQRLSNTTVSLEGQLYPDTYYFLEGSADIVLLKRAYQMMQEKLTKAWQTRADHLPFNSAYEALIAASLVEKEAYLNVERPTIAGVLVNRLRLNMKLQFDPTVIYGLGAHYDGKIHKKDLETDSAYNTYMHLGLPPTPIAIPSMGSILAVLHPEQHDYLYFVAKGDGSHQFSKTLAEHNQAVLQEGKSTKPYFNTPLVDHYLRNSNG